MNNVVQHIHQPNQGFIFGKGLFKKNESFSWNPDEEENPHLLMWGSSGSGKSYLLREIIQHLSQLNKHIHLVDLHGDLATPGDNSMQFGGHQRQYGINPFQFDATSEHAGPKQSIPSLISMFRSTFMPNMGGIQELVLRQLFSDTYLLAGLDKNNPETWMDGAAEDKTPDLQSMLKLIKDILIHFNSSDHIQDYMEKGIQDLKRFIKKHGRGHDLAEKQYEQMMSGLSSYIRSECSEKEEGEPNENSPLAPYKLDSRINLDNYRSKKAISTLESLAMYTNALTDYGVFHTSPPPVRAGVINRYNLQYMDDEIRRFFVEALVNKIFRAAQTRGEYAKRGQFSRGKKVDTYIILDEIQSVIPTNVGERNLPSQTYNRIAGEARKYGLGLIVITQSPGAYPTPMLSNITKRVGLKTNPVDVADAKKKLGVADTALFNHLQRPQTAIISNHAGGYDPVNVNRNI